MRGRTTLAIIAIGLALVLLFLLAPRLRLQTAAGEARAQTAPVRITQQIDGHADGSEPAGVDTPDRTAAGLSLHPGPQHSGVNPDGTLSSGTLLIGDSLTAGLVLSMRSHGTLGKARYIGIPTYSLSRFRSSPYYIDEDTAAIGLRAVCSPEFSGLSIAEAVRRAGESVEAIYFMLGTNQSAEVTVERYSEVLRYLCDCCPDATVYAETIPYSRRGLSDYERVNAVIYEAVMELRHEGSDRIFVLDICSAIGKDHNLADGLHIDDEGLVAWRDAIVERALNIY